MDYTQEKILIDKVFEVQGSPKLRVSLEPNSACGTAKGFSIGYYKQAGGVIDIVDAEVLANHILEAIKKHRDGIR